MNEEENSRYVMVALAHLYTFLCSYTVQRDSGKYTVSPTSHASHVFSSGPVTFLFGEIDIATYHRRTCAVTENTAHSWERLL